MDGAWATGGRKREPAGRADRGVIARAGDGHPAMVRAPSRQAQPGDSDASGGRWAGDGRAGGGRGHARRWAVSTGGAGERGAGESGSGRPSPCLQAQGCSLVRAYGLLRGRPSRHGGNRGPNAPGLGPRPGQISANVLQQRTSDRWTPDSGPWSASPTVVADRASTYQSTAAELRKSPARQHWSLTPGARGRGRQPEVGSPGSRARGREPEVEGSRWRARNMKRPGSADNPGRGSS